MVAITVSIPAALYEKMRARGMSGSKCAQIGIEAALRGGIDAITEALEQHDRLTRENKGLRDDVEIVKIRHENAQKIIETKNQEIAKLYKQVDAQKKQLDAAGFMPEKPKVGP